MGRDSPGRQYQPPPIFVADSEPSRSAYNMAIMRGLTHFPEARAAVIAELDRIGQPVDHPPPSQ